MLILIRHAYITMSAFLNNLVIKLVITNIFYESFINKDVDYKNKPPKFFILFILICNILVQLIYLF
jgi:hypothetical protein